MSNLLVPRSDVSEFRKRYRWMALFVVVIFTVLAGRMRTLGLPEVMLGIHPGFGGTVRAVRLPNRCTMTLPIA